MDNSGSKNPFFGKKHTEETKAKIKEKRALQDMSWRKGKKMSESVKKKVSETKKAQNLRGERAAGWKGGFPNCLDCGNKISRRKSEYCLKCVNKGERAPNWKGGVTPLILRIRHCYKYRQWRSDIFTRDDFTCQDCGVRGVYLEADHYPVMFSTIFHEFGIKSLDQALECEKLWDINNGRTLCRPCHDKTKHNKRNHG